MIFFGPLEVRPLSPGSNKLKTGKLSWKLIPEAAIYVTVKPVEEDRMFLTISKAL